MTSQSKFEAVGSVRLSDAVFRQVFQLITGGKLAPGERLPPERELASTLGVGRSSVREGLRVLDQLGLVDVRQGAGAFVMKDIWRARSGLLWLPWLIENREQVIELLQAREVLEPPIAGLAAANASDRDKEELRCIHAKLEAALAANAVEEAVTQDSAFHARIAQLAKNSLLEMLVRSMHEIVHSNIAGPYHFKSQVGTKAVREHAKILSAIVSGDVEDAGEAMRLHLRNVRATLEAAVRSARRSDKDAAARRERR
jgi:GntR family transcriptional regulator, transcriptional repressor for pyruvate dehydrogenase complex